MVLYDHYRLRYNAEKKWVKSAIDLTAVQELLSYLEYGEYTEGVVLDCKQCIYSQSERMNSGFPLLFFT